MLQLPAELPPPGPPILMPFHLTRIALVPAPVEGRAFAGIGVPVH